MSNASSIGSGSLADLARLRDFERHRLSSWDRTGANRDFVLVPAGERVSLGRIEGAGCVKHVWVTTAAIVPEAHELCSLVLRMWWDGETHPSVEAPLGDFFGVGFGLRRNFVSLPLQMSPEDGRGFNCWFPMPFADGARFEIENQGANARIFYFYVDYESYRSLDPALARFHAWWNRNPRTAGDAKGWGAGDYATIQKRLAGPWAEPNLGAEKNYVLLDVRGRGQYVGCVLNVDVFERQLDDWYGEGDDMIFVDEDLDGDPPRWPPRLHGTGTEDYFNTAFCPTQEYCAPYHGLTVYSGTKEWPWGGKNSMYRFHVEDPIRFERAIRVTIETGHDNALANDYSSVAYWYQHARSEPLPALPPLERRLPRPDRAAP
ncbi:MAG: hypothetical protein DCC71_22875 [Proteobacteria bacterium]|nr:MAG: hypothetical protein DCC71_22875 [Pseudomonadota bacterium]